MSSALGLPAVGVDQDFFEDLAGDSLSAAIAISSLRAEADGATATVRDLYTFRTARAVAAEMDSRTASEEAVSAHAAPRLRAPHLVGALQGLTLSILVAVSVLILTWMLTEGLPWAFCASPSSRVM